MRFASAERSTSRPRPFAFVEIGAGYGHWSFAAHAALRHLLPARATVATQQPPPPPRLLLVDVVDTLAPAIESLAALNGVADPSASVHFHTGFVVGSTAQERGGTDAAGEGNGGRQKRVEAGIKEYSKLWGTGVGATSVQRVSLRTLLRRSRMPCVLDLVDIDIQGGEYARTLDGGRGLFSGNETIELLTRRARRVHIGLHSASPRINDELADLFRSWGWRVQHLLVRPEQNTRAAARAGKSPVLVHTDVGPVELGDGVASFLNPNPLVC